MCSRATEVVSVLQRRQIFPLFIEKSTYGTCQERIFRTDAVKNDAGGYVMQCAGCTKSRILRTFVANASIEKGLVSISSLCADNCVGSDTFCV